MKRTCVIISARPVSEAMKGYIPDNAYIIAADAGWRRAEALHIQPDLVLGDFDSAPPPTGAAELLRLPAEKDDTDTHFALRVALERGFQDIVFLGTLGGRLDQTLASLHTLLCAAQQGASALMADEHCEIRCFGNGSLTLPRQAGRYVSVFAAGGDAGGVWLEGLHYPLHNATLTQSFPIGVSNEFEAETATITCEKGYVYVMTVQEVSDH